GDGGVEKIKDSGGRKLILKQAFRHSVADAGSLPSPGFQPEKVLTVSSRPDYFANSNPAAGCGSDRRRDLNFHGAATGGGHSSQVRLWNRLSRFLSWLARPAAAIFVNSSLCIGHSVTTMRTHSPIGKKSTIDLTRPATQESAQKSGPPPGGRVASACTPTASTSSDRPLRNRLKKAGRRRVGGSWPSASIRRRSTGATSDPGWRPSAAHHPGRSS